ncbi:MAG TPA: tetratricopeptide repeat protein [Pyrinomonadaceae bacterium]|jgi:tetratricopeptide (TPR) repeat protein|nr:tetratricopeptide repeat protein [Pyrinomonadaceae bacterium]
MTRQTFRLASAAVLLALASTLAHAQSGATRPRRVTPVQPTNTTATDSTNGATGATASAGRTATPAASTGPASTAHAFALLQQKQYDAALQEARQVAAADEKNSEAWKIAGFAEFNLKQYAKAAEDLSRAVELRKASGTPDPETERALAQSYFFAEDYERALPLLVNATKTPAGSKPDADMLYYRAVAEMNLKKSTDAERSFNEVVKVDPKNKFALFYLGQLAYARADFTAAINALNRATLADTTVAQAWQLLVSAYLGRAQAAQGAAADADYLAAVRAADSLARVKNDEQTALLLGQALFYAKQYVRAASTLERAAASPNAPDGTHFLLGYSYFQSKNYVKAIPALEQAATRTPNNADIYRLLGFSYETGKQYAKALAAYEKGLQLAPDDAYFKEGADRVRPFAK